MNIKEYLENFEFKNPSNNKYLDEFNSISKKYRDHTKDKKPNEYVERWFWLIKEFFEGYDWIAPEFRNDITCRRDIEPLLYDKELDKYPEHQYFKDKVEELDNLFKEMSFEYEPWGKDPWWWNRRVLKFAGEEYVYWMKNEHNVDIELKKTET